ncbi:hypothetical protein ACHAWF_001928 [Thalassiosira exigua]
MSNPKVVKLNLEPSRPESPCSPLLFPATSRQGVCDIALSFGEGSDSDKDKRMSRPFGAALLNAGHHDLGGHQLFFSDPSGTPRPSEPGAQSDLAEGYHEDMTLEEVEENDAGDVEAGDGGEGLDGVYVIGEGDGGQGVSRGHGQGGGGRVGEAVMGAFADLRERRGMMREKERVREDTTPCRDPMDMSRPASESTALA